MSERKPLIGVTCNYDYRDVLGNASGVGPELYGQFPKTYCGMVFPMRDRQDLAVARYALDKDLPMLGICRGIQVEGCRFAVAVQRRPEMMYDSAEQLKLVRAFVDACR